jgi:hypothetical protein
MIPCGSAAAGAPGTVRSTPQLSIGDRTFRNAVDRALHRGDQGFFLHGLVQKGHGAGFQSFEFAFWRIIGRQDDHRNTSECGVGLQPLQHNKSAAAWQAQIQDDGIGPSLLSDRSRLHPIGRKDRVVPVLLEARTHHKARIDRVVDDEDFFSPYGTLLCL